MANFKEDILHVVGEEDIIGIVLSEDYTNRSIPEDLESKVVSWEEVESLLDYEYSTGRGSQDCHSIYAWTETRVIFISEYDGSTNVTSLPRNPVDISPKSIS